MKLRVLDLGRSTFAHALAIQEEVVEARKRDAACDTLILVEHDPVYTLGRKADSANVLASAEELASRGIDVIRTSRGGQVTYHGPGQLVGYPVIDLGARRKGVLWYVEQLERTLIRVLSDFGLEGRTDAANRGVWIDNEKIAALGVRVTRHVTMHGFALNVAVDLSDYAGIVPCGIRDKGVTSLHMFAPDVTLEAVKPVVVDAFSDLFGYTGVDVTNDFQKRDGKHE
jgi:lipoyl(octanoyl) transferase